MHADVTHFIIFLAVAQKELEDLSKYKEEHRPGPIHLTPEKLGIMEMYDKYPLIC